MINLNKKSWKTLSQSLMGGAVVAVILSAVGYMGYDIWLASTQWLLVAAILALFGLYARTNY